MFFGINSDEKNGLRTSPIMGVPQERYIGYQPRDSREEQIWTSNRSVRRVGSVSLGRGMTSKDIL